MAELDKERQLQYRQKVEENFPNQLAIVDMDAFYERFLKLVKHTSPQIAESFERAVTENATVFNKKHSLRYGQNPGGPAAFYAEKKAKGPCTANMKLLQQGKGLGYINTADSDLVLRLTKSLYDMSGGKLVAVIAKHEMPSGVALGSDLLETYETAWGTDSLSSFGGVVCLSYIVTPEVAEKIILPARNTEVLIATGYNPEALEILAKRNLLRVIKVPYFSQPVKDNGLEYKRTEGGLLVENRFNTKILSTTDIDCISEAKPTPDDLEAALLAWHTAVFTRSNAVVIGTKDKIHGIGSGQRSRIDAAENAVRLSERGYGPKGTFMASDAFMPATDVVELASAHGIRGITYPLGSKKDEEVLESANESGLIMLITRKPGEKQGGERCFLHR